MTPLETLILATYFFILIILAGYGWHRYYLVYVYMKHRDKVPVPAGRFDELPTVTVQLPIYNEMYVVDRLIESVCRMDYPRDRFEVQVLDDSTDETQIDRPAGGAAGRGAGRGHHLSAPRPIGPATRPARSRPGCRWPRASSSRSSTPTSCRRRTSCSAPSHHFTDPKVGVVQARWGHINAGLLAADADPVDPARRALRPRARRPQPRGALLQLQRHGRHLAARGNRRRAAAGSTTR